MDPRRALPFLLLAVCVIGAASSYKNGRGGHNLVRRARRISLNEYLVPPPLPKFHPAIRTGRLAAGQQPAEAPGYFSQFMSWLNPFNLGSPSPAPPPHAEAPYAPSPKFIQPAPPSPGSSAKIYDDSSPPVYDRPPLPPHIFNNHPEYPPPAKAKNCNPCNKIPWVPMQHGELSHSRDTSFVAPPPPPPPAPQIPSLNGGYPPSSGHEAAHDAYHAASQEVRAPDFSFVPPLPIAGQEVPLIGPLPNPHLYPGPMPPLFKAADFNYPIQATYGGNSDYLGAPPPSASASGFHAENDSFPGIAEHGFNGAHNEQFAYADTSAHSGVGAIHRGLGHNNPGTGNGGFQHLDVRNHGAHGDLSSSGTQVSHTNPVLGQQGYEDVAAHQGSFNTINHQTSVGSSGVLDHQVSNNGEFYDITGPNGPLGEPLDNSSLINQDPPPSSYGISGFDRVPSNYEHRYNDLSPSGSAVKDSHAPPRPPDETSAKIENLIHIEQSPLLDLTRKGESRTDSSPIQPTSNAFVGSSKSGEIAATTLASGDELFDARQGVASTESHFAADHLQTIDPSGTTRDLNGSIHDARTLREQSSGQTGYLWPNVPSTTTRITEREPFLSTLMKFYDGIDEEASEQSTDSEDEGKLSARQQGAKRNKQVQVIIPYTSQYTPFPFHSSHEQKYGRKDSYAGGSNRDNYVSEESRRQIKVANLPDGSRTLQTWPTTSAILEDVTRRTTAAKMNNSIDVHRLQKNIDNWTIQEYSRGTTASTVSPSSVNPYLFPSKQIPDGYLTTTEPVNYVDAPHDNIKTFTLAGFSFNDLDHEGSASNRVEGSRVQVIRNGDSKSTESSATTATKNDITWQGFSVDISPVNKERVYVVTPQPIVTTPRSRLVEQRKEKTTKEAERNSKESMKSSETDTKRTRKKSNTFESIEKAYQVLPQAVNNLAVASTGPESVPLWGIMEHEEFASLDESEHDNEDNESPDIPVLYAGHSKVSRARR